MLFGDQEIATHMLSDNLDDKEKQIEMGRIEDAKRKLAATNVTAVH